MLETVALCTVLFDHTGLWNSYLPQPMQEQIHEELAVEPWAEAVQEGMSTALGTASESNAELALKALFAAEDIYHQMSPDEVFAETMNCAKRYSFLAADKN